MPSKEVNLEEIESMSNESEKAIQNQETAEIREGNI